MTTLNIKISTQNPKTMIYTTLNRIYKYLPCPRGWERLLRHLGTDFPMDSPFPLVEVLNAEGDGLEDCLWALRAEPQHEKLYRLYAVNRARSVQHLTMDPRSIAAIDVAERYAYGTATKGALDAALDAACDAACDAAWAAACAAERAATCDAACAAERDAALAAACDAACAAARDAALAAAGDAACAAERDAACAAAWAAAGDAAWAEARAAARAAASTSLREMLTSHHAMPGEPAQDAIDNIQV